ncbi:hypothetical protein FRX31_030564 [Thalictrum thalictroides]|uniref:Uncharacterized protein n=1 Tax=Thalictrum thalictroides TaxID=46969 RepID=A0A7J6V459_THATH|nr:hypothetical protein FRX31_030564 [Thalictrum thalictroides]
MADEILDGWRNYLTGCHAGDIFDVINVAIILAKHDHPKDFKIRRHQIIAMLNASVDLFDAPESIEKESDYSNIDNNDGLSDSVGSQTSSQDGVEDSVDCQTSSQEENNKKRHTTVQIKVKKNVITPDSNQDDKGKSQVDSITAFEEKKDNSIEVDGERETSTVSEASKCLDEEEIQLKIKSSKRKLQQGYDHAAKNQHLVKPLRLDELPQEPSRLPDSQRKRKGTATVQKW